MPDSPVHTTEQLFHFCKDTLQHMPCPVLKARNFFLVRQVKINRDRGRVGKRIPSIQEVHCMASCDTSGKLKIRALSCHCSEDIYIKESFVGTWEEVTTNTISVAKPTTKRLRTYKSKRTRVSTGTGTKEIEMNILKSITSLDGSK